MRFVLFVIAIFCSWFNYSCADLLQKESVATLREFPLTVEEVIRYKKSAIEELLTNLLNYKTQPKDVRNFDTVVVGWHRLIETFFVKTPNCDLFSL
jgi:hypothetical protein